MLAVAAHETQVAALQHAMHSTVAQPFDSLRDRLVQVMQALPAGARLDGDDHDDDLPQVAWRECCVCLAAEPDTVLLPCGHASYCGGCAADLDTCAVCRTRIDRRVRIYF